MGVTCLAYGCGELDWMAEVLTIIIFFSLFPLLGKQVDSVVSWAVL